MELKTFKQSVPNIYLSNKKIAIDVTMWASFEGCNVIVTNNADQSIRLAASLTWEEVAMLMTALSAAQTAPE